MDEKLVTVFGGSGFVGRYVVRRLAMDGWRIRVACRNPNDAMFLRTYGVVGQIALIFGNIRDDDSVRAVTHGADAVVNCVGILDETSHQGFDAVQHEGAERIARIASEEGVQRMVQISAIGADADSESEYARTKAQGEQGVREHMPDAVIIRPSIVFGPEDSFFNRFASMARFGPVLPVVGGETRFQPVYVDDVAKAVALAVAGKATAPVYELGGPHVDSFRGLMNRMLGVIRRRRLIFDMPIWMAKMMATGLALGHYLTLGIVPRALTHDQIVNLETDNVVSGDYPGLTDLGIEPVAMEAVLEEYLTRFRPSGQYDAIKESARNLRS